MGNITLLEQVCGQLFRKHGQSPRQLHKSVWMERRFLGMRTYRERFGEFRDRREYTKWNKQLTGVISSVPKLPTPPPPLDLPTQE